MRNIHNIPPSTEERLALAKELQEEFAFSAHQALYLSVQSYGYCNDVLRNYKKIRSDMESLKEVLKGIFVL